VREKGEAIGRDLALPTLYIDTATEICHSWRLVASYHLLGQEEKFFCGLLLWSE